MKNKLIEEMDKFIAEKTAEYNDLHEVIYSFEGKLADEENIKQLNEVLHKLQDIYQEIHEVIHFIQYRQEWATNISKYHQTYMENLIKAGAIEIEEQ